MKLFIAGTLLQIFYCLCCLLLVIFMPLYTAFHPSMISDVCLTIGEVCFFIITLSPVGLIGTILDIIACFRIKSIKKAIYIGWTIVAPFVMAVSWFIAICFWVAQTGGV